MTLSLIDRPPKTKTKKELVVTETVLEFVGAMPEEPQVVVPMVNQMSGSRHHPPNIVVIVALLKKLKKEPTRQRNRNTTGRATTDCPFNASEPIGVQGGPEQWP